MLQLDVLAGTKSFWYAPTPGKPLELNRFFTTKRQALEMLLAQRYPLSHVLQKRIKTHEEHRSNSCFLCQLCLGIILPGIPTRGSWDYDRDMDMLRREVSVVLASHLGPPEEYELVEHIDSEASFRDGKVLFKLYLS